MLRFGKIKSLALGAAIALGATVGLESLDFAFFNAPGTRAVAQENQRRGNREWNGQRGQGGQRGDFGGQGGQRGDFGGQGGQRGNFGGQGGQRGNFGGQGGQRGFNFDDMTKERFDQLRNMPFADRIKERVGEERWARWERGEFGPANNADAEAADAAAKAQAKEDGTLEEMPELTEEEKQEAEERLRAGTVPDFNEEGVPHYSVETEADYYRQAMARRDDVLVDGAPLALRYYARYIMNKYDANGDGSLQRKEWENRLEGAQAIDLNGDWDLSDQEILYYMTRFAKDRTIFNPNPIRVNPQRTNVLVDNQEQETLIRPASAPPKRVSEEEAKWARLVNDGVENLSELSDEEIRDLFTDGNPALESVDDDELLDSLLNDMDESAVREYAAPPQVLRGAPVWFLARDKNGDGQLTILEFAPNLSQRSLALFGRYDADGDEIITADEAKKGPSAQ
ncbi:MAG: hypothetical protein IK077_02965 [Thermoguttaceae bacterium]|nr:hypothetical protein [Thermoguttaceae bacterium]